MRVSECGAVLGADLLPAGTLLGVRGTAGKMTADCPNCKAWVDDKDSRPTTFRMSDGITHAAPDMWLAGRSQRVQRENGFNAVEAGMQAMCDWAWHCGIESQMRTKGAK